MIEGLIDGSHLVDVQVGIAFGKRKSREETEVKYKTKISSSGCRRCTELAAQDTAKPPNSNVENLQSRRRALGADRLPIQVALP